ncbi:MAG: HAD family hydrolase [Sphingomonadaceae bacterium]|nr:HAD family hydrolase [Sphingomonadaceae bacterium]
MTIRIAMWSGPRNISTAMMRSFGSRADCFVTDEPFYGAFLKATGEAQPLADETMASMDCDWGSIAQTMRGDPPGGAPIWYQKHMPHHMVGGISIDDFPDHRHAFLIRDPARVIASYAAKGVNVVFENLGFGRMADYFEREADRQGKAPPVIDSTDVLRDPNGVLSQLCTALDIRWDEAMLRWKPGRRPEDGVWGRHWYNRVEESSGFAPPPGDEAEVPEASRAVHEQALPYYEKLAAHRLRPA